MDKRVFEEATGKFGTVVKSSGILGLKDCKAVVFDDGTKGAYFGKKCNEVVCVADAGDTVPVDLVGVWRNELDPKKAATLVEGYLALDADGKADVLKRWESTTKRSRTKFKI